MVRAYNEMKSCRNIIHLTATDTDANGAGSRLPEINYLESNSEGDFQLQVSYIASGTGKENEKNLYMAKSLTKESWSKVVLVVDTIRKVIVVSVTGATKIPGMTMEFPTPARSFWSNVKVYVSNPWSIPAGGEIRNIYIGAPPKPSLAPTKRPLSWGTVPPSPQPSFVRPAERLKMNEEKAYNDLRYGDRKPLWGYNDCQRFVESVDSTCRWQNKAVTQIGFKCDPSEWNRYASKMNIEYYRCGCAFIDGVIRITTINLGQTKLEGSIPTTIGYLNKLESLILHTNHLNGTLPVQLGLLTNLKILSLQINSFTGSLPKQIGNLKALTNLDLSNNMFGGSLPAQLGQLTNLQRMNMQYNRFTSAVPNSFCKLTGCTSMELFDRRSRFRSGLTSLPPCLLARGMSLEPKAEPPKPGPKPNQHKPGQKPVPPKSTEVPSNTNSIPKVTLKLKPTPKPKPKKATSDDEPYYGN